MPPNNTANFWNKQFSTLELASELAPKDKVILERCLDFFGDVRGKEVLDIGCGLGGSAIPLAALGANVTAVDVSATAV